jgi:hypothetical protein
MKRPLPTLLRKGAVVRVAGRGQDAASSVSAWAETYVDLKFDDDHVERWSGAGRLREGPLDELEDDSALVAWGTDTLDEQTGSLLAEIGREFAGDIRAALAEAPVEIVIEHHAEMPDVGSSVPHARSGTDARMRFRLRVEMWLEVPSLAEAEAVMGRAEGAAYDALGSAAIPVEAGSALWRTELTPIDQAARDALTSEDLGPGISSAAFTADEPDEP